jgi:shikimate kinase
MKANIALIGFMGAGKTAVGKVLAKRLGKEFVELDLLIEQRTGKSIPEIFQQDGEVAFRELEIELTREVSRGKNLVIACGGGIVLNRINIDRLKNESIIVYLVASPRVLLRRVSGSGEKRPLLKTSNRGGDEPRHYDLDARSPLDRSIQELLRFRKPFYDRAADIRIDTSKLDIDCVAERIIVELKKNESFNS